MKPYNTGYMCLMCGHLVLFKSKRKYDSFAGNRCPKCNGKIVPIKIGIDLVSGNDYAVDLAGPIKAMEDYLINGEGPEPKGLFGSNDS